MKRVAIIGAGPAGLMAAEAALAAGARVALYDGMPSPARKFLMAGKSGLNITHSEDEAAFLARYDAPDGRLAEMVTAFGPKEIRDWMQGLGIESYVGSSGRVYPVGMKASPLLRAWLARLDAGGATLHTRHYWRGWDAVGRLSFYTPQGEVAVEANAVILALGGASWARLGSDGEWAPVLQARGVEIMRFGAANCGFLVPWSDHIIRKYEGAPVKNVHLTAFGRESRGDFVITMDGIEGGAVYPLAARLGYAAQHGESLKLHVDFLPDMDLAELVGRLSSGAPKESLANRLRKKVRLSPVKIALWQEMFRDSALRDPETIARTLKDFPLLLKGPQDIDKAISTTGGVSWNALDETLMLKTIPGTYCAGEMVAWDAPTGGYLLTACLAMGRFAGEAAAR